MDKIWVTYTFYILHEIWCTHFYYSEISIFLFSQSLTAFANPLLRLLSHRLDFPLKSFLSWITTMILRKDLASLIHDSIFKINPHYSIYDWVFCCKAIIQRKMMTQFHQVSWHNLIVPPQEKLKQNGKEFEVNPYYGESTRPS